MVGWMRRDGTRTEYIGLVGHRWRSKEIPHAHRVPLEEIPLPFHYMPGAKDA